MVAMDGRVMPRKKREIIELNPSQLRDVVRRAEQSLDPEDAELIRAVFDSYEYVTDLVGDRNTTIRRLRQLLFGASTEKTDAVVNHSDATEGGSDQPEEAAASDDSPLIADDSEGSNADEKPAAPGHGRNGAQAYVGGDQVEILHETLQAGDACPACQRGTVYEKSPGVVVRITGQAPLQATLYQLQKLRCGLCGKVFTARLPAEAGTQKYDARAASMIALLKYGSGMPFNRLQGLQWNLGIPLPASTQWDIVHAFSSKIAPVYAELIRQAAQGDVLHNDDTTVKILELMGERARTAEENDSSQPARTGMFTSGVVSIRAGRRIALFFSGRQHAGENLADVLKLRAAELARPIQMCDALSRNLPGDLETIVANCLAHARRQFVDVYDRFPPECGYVLQALKVVYHNDAVARQQKMSPEQRLRFHQEHSRKTMDELSQWLTRQFEQKLVEPNSALGSAINYLLRRWQKLTLFLREAGAPLDNNICERALKKAILHRRNALFYKTRRGAQVGDMYMSLIHTCELCQANPFEYLTQVLGHTDEVSAEPELWMPWTYRATLLTLQPAA